MSLSKLWEMVKDREACPWGCKESDTTQQPKDNNSNSYVEVLPAFLWERFPFLQPADASLAVPPPGGSLPGHGEVLL